MSGAGKSGGFGDLGARVVSALILAGGAAVLIWLGGIFYAAMLSVMSVVLVWEYRRIVFGIGGSRGEAFYVMAALAGLLPFYVYFFHGADLFGVNVLLILAAFAVAALFVVDQRRAIWTAPFLIYLGYAVLVAMRLRTGGITPIFMIVALVAAADIGAYFVGRFIGGPKLWPRVSPKKTWSGAIGGWLAAIVAVVLLRLIEPVLAERGPGFLTDWNAWYLTISLAFFIAFASQIGDLAESALKRYFGVKDSSNLVPGHGGLLDRLDGQLAGFVMMGLLTIFYF